MKKRKTKQSVDYINAYLGELILNTSFGKFMLTKMSKRRMKIKRKNGNIETHILMSDGSIDTGGMMPFVKLKHGDKVIQ